MEKKKCQDFSREIKKLMIEKGVTNSEIAVKAKVSTSMVSQVIHGKKRSKRIERLIEKMLGRKFWSREGIIEVKGVLKMEIGKWGGETYYLEEMSGRKIYLPPFPVEYVGKKVVLIVKEVA